MTQGIVYSNITRATMRLHKDHHKTLPTKSSQHGNSTYDGDCDGDDDGDDDDDNVNNEHLNQLSLTFSTKT